MATGHTDPRRRARILDAALGLIADEGVAGVSHRKPAYRELTQEWTAGSRTHLEKHFDADTARQLDALIEGLILHRALAREPHDRALTLDAVTRITTVGRGDR
ncbi:hypothetical protein AB0N31_03805 [Streptomyces sp. NPDC051051]|uniref:hypothetical protein n=1 Tax=Streptomyces sp. NPDC051051 TaxID=3155666 RepID=UPI0034474320